MSCFSRTSWLPFCLLWRDCAVESIRGQLHGYVVCLYNTRKLHFCFVLFCSVLFFCFVLFFYKNLGPLFSYLYTPNGRLRHGETRDGIYIKVSSTLRQLHCRMLVGKDGDVTLKFASSTYSPFLSFVYGCQFLPRITYFCEEKYRI